MILSQSHKFIFVHVPKTAGTAMTSALEPFGVYPPRTLWRSFVRRLPIQESPDSVYLRKHETAAGVRRKLGSDVFDQFHRFAVVRNPYDHAVSHYEFMKQFRIPKIAEKVANMSFSEYLRYRMKPPFWNDTFFARLPNQSYFLADKDGTLLVHRLLRFETLADDFNAMASDLGMEGVTLKRENQTISRTDKRPWQSYFDEESKALAEDLYAQDFDAFGYAKTID
ncbi:sulfotransferase family protein [Shimia isoporae]|uniref:Sulfotransferase family protein n=1 Tax=Shimia isoporae TaxID=647720 RepID=A0A4R1NM38_9RHOB|nr:sulfotransferase family 2 domain-containing protein [Shimia isoporae]TCL09467.1 sulfotransferase family protein [Shimia isoporae]